MKKMLRVKSTLSSHDMAFLFCGNLRDEFVGEEGTISENNVAFTGVFEKVRSDPGVVFFKVQLKKFEEPLVIIHLIWTYFPILDGLF